MFERYTERARRTLFFARYEASQKGAIGIAPVHLLLGILREPSDVRARLFEQSGTSFDVLKTDIDRVAAATGAQGPAHIPFTPATQRALGAAAEWADRLLHQSIDNEHLLLGVITVTDPVIAPILTRHGVNADAVRELLVARGAAAVADSADVFNLERARAHSSPPASALVFDVHISRREGIGQESTRGTNGEWRLDGFLLKSALAKCCGDSDFDFPVRRVEIDSRFDTTSRYDFRVRGINLRRTTEKELILKGIEEYFGAAIIRERRTVDAYVLTAPDGRVAGLQESATELGGIASGFMSFGVVAEEVPLDLASIVDPSDLAGHGMIGGMSGQSISPAMLCYMLEMMLGRPVVDETGLTGQLDIHLHEVMPVTSQDFFDRLYRGTGLKITEAPREVSFVVMRPR